MEKLLESFSLISLMIILPLFISLVFPIISIRNGYFIVLFYLGIIKNRNISIFIILCSSIFVDSMHFDIFGLTFFYGILLFYVFCEYVNLVCVINYSFMVVWGYFIIFLILINILNILLMYMNSTQVDYDMLIKQLFMCIILFPFVCKITEMLSDEK